MRNTFYIFLFLTLPLFDTLGRQESLSMNKDGAHLVNLSRDIVYNFDEKNASYPKIKVFRSLGINDEYINVDYAAMLDKYDTVVVASVTSVELIAITLEDNVQDARWYRVICKVRSVPRGDFPFETMAFITYVSGHCYPWKTYAQDQTFHFGMRQENGVWEIAHQVRASRFAPYRIEDYIPFFNLRHLDKATDYSQWNIFVDASREDAKAYATPKEIQLVDVSIEQKKFFIITYAQRKILGDLEFDYGDLAYVVYSWPDGKLIYDAFRADFSDIHVVTQNRELYRMVWGSLVRRHEKEIFRLTREIKSTPNEPVNYQERARAFSMILDFNSAFADLAKAEELDMSDINTYLVRTEVYYWMQECKLSTPKDDDAWVANLTKIIELFPDDAVSYYDRAHFYIEQEKIEAALMDIARLLELDIMDAEAYLLRGNAYKHQEDYGKAIQNYTKTIELRSRDGVAYKNRGDIYFLLEEYNKAIDDYTEAVKYYKFDLSVYKTRGDAYKALGDTENAEADYTRALDTHKKP